MAFRDYSQQFAPVNVFGGLGKGLGEGLGAGVTKTIKRPLFKSLADNYRNKRLEQAKLSTLGELGLQEAPRNVDDKQYPIFQQMIEQKMAPVDERYTNALSLFEGGDYGEAKDYLLTEPKAGPGAKDKKLTASEQKMQAMQSPAAIAKFEEIKANREKVGKVADDTQKGAITPEEGEALIAQLNTERQNLLNDYSILTGVDLKDQTWNQYADVITKQLAAKNTAGQIDARAEGEKAKVLKDGKDFVKDKIGAGAPGLLKELRALGRSKVTLERLRNNFSKVKDDPNELFTAVKALAQIIEPGLQVTEGEVAGFLGRSAASDFASAIREFGTLGISLVKKADLQKAEVDAGKSNDEALWKILKEGTQLLHDTQSEYSRIMEDLQGRTSYAANKHMKPLYTGNKFLNAELREQITDSVESDIFTAFPTVTLIEPIPAGTPMPETDASWDLAPTPDGAENNKPYEGGQSYADGTEVSLTDDPAKLKANEQRTKGAQASSTLNPVKAQASAGAAAVSNKAIDDAIDQFLE